MGIGGNFADLTGVDWRQPSDRSRGQEIQEWFNKAAFAVNAAGDDRIGPPESASRARVLERRLLIVQELRCRRTTTPAISRRVL